MVWDTKILNHDDNVFENDNDDNDTDDGDILDTLRRSRHLAAPEYEAIQNHSTCHVDGATNASLDLH